MSQAQSPEPREIIAETRLIPGGAPDVKLQLINKRPDDLRRFSPERTLVMMHGATFPSASLFDVSVAGASVMDTKLRTDPGGPIGSYRLVDPRA